jgi:hypothetical protein
MPKKTTTKQLDPLKKLTGIDKKITLPRLILESIRLNDTKTRFAVVVYNEGTMPSFSAVLNVYCGDPNIIATDPNNQLILAATSNFKIGIGERKNISVGFVNNLDPSCMSFFGILFDPLLDPFPFSNDYNFNWLEKNLLNYNPPPSFTGWQQYDYVDSRDENFSNGSLVTNATWKNVNKSEISTSIPSQPLTPAIQYSVMISGFPYRETCFIPGSPISQKTELRYVINLDTHALAAQQIVRSEIAKGNISIKLSGLQINYRRTPNKDKSAFWLEGRRVQRGVDSLLPSEQMQLICHTGNWERITIVKGFTNFNTIHIKLMCNRIDGSITNAYFAQIKCLLIHRQLKCFGIFSI